MKHEVKSIPAEEILANRSNAYEFLDFDKQETLDKCYFIHSKETNTSSSTICANCGKQKIFHNKFLPSRLESLLKKNNLFLKEVINYSQSKLKELGFRKKSINELQSLK